jgi:glycosyltransferase involved in cell wall biosynthesis
LAASLQSRSDVGFLFVGRGSEAQRIREEALQRGLKNTVFFDEIDPDEIPGLYAQCHVGLVALDPRHRTHNIPGKFLTYMQAGLPVLASINPGNDLIDLITTEGVGRVCTTQDPEELKKQALALADDVRLGGVFYERCKALSRKMFSAETAARQVLQALAPKP